MPLYIKHHMHVNAFGVQYNMKCILYNTSYLFVILFIVLLWLLIVQSAISVRNDITCYLLDSTIELTFMIWLKFM